MSTEHNPREHAQKILERRLPEHGLEDEYVRLAMDVIDLAHRYERLQELTADKPKREERTWEDLILNTMSSLGENSTLQQVEDWAGLSNRRPVSIIFEFDKEARERTKESLHFRYADWYENCSSHTEQGRRYMGLGEST